jgi:phage shock protein A
MWSRIKRIFAAVFGGLLDSAEDPVLLLDQVVSDMRKAEIEGKRQVAAAMASETRLSHQTSKATGEATTWLDRAKTAVRQGDDALAKEALVRHRQCATIAQQYADQAAKASADVRNLQEGLRAMSTKIEEASAKRGILKARAKRAEARKFIEETRAGLRTNSAFVAFERLEEKVELAEAEAEAMASMVEGDTGSGLAQRFRDMETTAFTDAALAALKQDLGMGSLGLPSTTRTVIDAEFEQTEREFASLKER